MIVLTRMDRQQMYFNPDHIISIEETPDTVITLFNGNRYIVMERAATIISRVIAFRARIIRRSEGHNGKKYLQRQQIRQFKGIAIDKEAVFHDSESRQSEVPFHSRDY